MITDVDLSGLTFTVEDESLTEAHVHVEGTIYYSHQGQRKYLTYTGPNNLHTVEASGLGWCLTTDMLTSDVLTR
jgi:hypothetical protein